MFKRKSNLWILTEERPKNSVVQTILEEYCRISKVKLSNRGVLQIKPIIVANKFSFDYAVENVSVAGIGSIIIKIVSGKSSFMDYIVVKQVHAPINHSLDNIVMMVEETKTSDAESRNTGIGQRASKFIFASYYCPDVPKYMLYNEDTTAPKEKLSSTNVMGTMMLLTQGIRFLNKNNDGLSVFANIEELIGFKTEMRNPPKGNVPIRITKRDNKIFISGRLAKPADAGNIGHDPNIGTLSCIAATLRKLGWQGEIVIAEHGVCQTYVSSNNTNKFVSLCRFLNMKLDGLTLPDNITPPEFYWEYAVSSEKVASILLHITAQYSGIHGIYENHAGCERGYYKRPDGSLVALHKKDELGDNINLPDVVLRNDRDKEIYLIEGKLDAKHAEGLADLNEFDSIENLYIKRDYPRFSVVRWITLFGDHTPNMKEKVLLSVAGDGSIALAKDAPQAIVSAFKKLGFKL